VTWHLYFLGCSCCSTYYPHLCLRDGYREFSLCLIWCVMVNFTNPFALWFQCMNWSLRRFRDHWRPGETGSDRWVEWVCPSESFGAICTYASHPQVDIVRTPRELKHASLCSAWWYVLFSSIPVSLLYNMLVLLVLYYRMNIIGFIIILAVWLCPIIAAPPVVGGVL